MHQQDTTKASSDEIEVAFDFFETILETPKSGKRSKPNLEQETLDTFIKSLEGAA